MRLLAFYITLHSTLTVVSAFWRLPCDPLVVQRADPLTNPGSQSGHVHVIAGGSHFNLAMGPKDARRSRCSSCLVKQDLSNYWTPSLYFHHANGSFTSLQGGGMTVYYLTRSHSSDKGPIRAFPPGLRILAGDPYSRSAADKDNIGWSCIGGKSEPKKTKAFPGQNCPDALRGEIMFPSCWDGKNLDSANHASHVAYPIGGESGPCPKGFDTRLVTLFYEVWWNVDGWKDTWKSAKNPKQPFVTSAGDATGHGYHGDFLDGWDSDVLQHAIEICTNDSGVIQECAAFDLYEQSGPEKCIASAFIDEQVEGSLESLPGNNPVTSGPDRVTILSEESPPGILDQARIWGGRTANHSIEVNKDGTARPAGSQDEGDPYKLPATEKEESQGKATDTTSKVSNKTLASSSSASKSTESPLNGLEDSTAASVTATAALASGSDEEAASSSGVFSSLKPLQFALIGGGLVIVLLCAVSGIVLCTRKRDPVDQSMEQRSLAHRFEDDSSEDEYK